MKKIKSSLLSLLVISVAFFIVFCNNIKADDSKENPTATLNCYIDSDCEYDFSHFEDSGSNYGSGLRPLAYTTENLGWLNITVTNYLDDPSNPDGNTKAPLPDGTPIYEVINMNVKGTAPSTGQVGFLTIDETDAAGNTLHLVYRFNILYRYGFNFNVNGGVDNTLTKTNWDVSGGMDDMTALLPKPTTATWGDYYVEPTRDNFTFNGWYSDEATMVPYQWGSDLTEDTTVYAGWLGDFTLTYDGNGNTGGVLPAMRVISKNEKATSDVVVVPADNLVRKGYTFEGWNTAADGSGTTYQPADTFPLVSNTKLYALWSKDETSNNNAAKSTNKANGSAKQSNNSILKNNEQNANNSLPKGGIDMNMPILFTVLGVMSLGTYAWYNKK